MKNFITTITILSLSFSIASATNTPETLVSNEEIEVVTLDIADIEIFKSASFDHDSDNLSFTTLVDISVVQIYDENGSMEFQLPVMSDNVKINKNLFGQGTYKLGFMLEGENQLRFTEVVVK